MRNKVDLDVSRQLRADYDYYNRRMRGPKHLLVGGVDAGDGLNRGRL
jgi:hypothetical protein